MKEPTDETRRLLLLYAGGEAINSEHAQVIADLQNTPLMKTTYCYKKDEQRARLCMTLNWFRTLLRKNT